MREIMAWGSLLTAGLLDVFWAYTMKKSEGFSHLGWSLTSFVTVALFIWLLSRAMQTIPLGISYAVWAGVGTIGTVMVGALLFNEPLNLMRAICVLLILAGIIGLKIQ